MHVYNIFLSLSCLIPAAAQTLTQHVGSTTCGNSGSKVEYQSGADLRICAKGTLKGYGTIYTRIECVESTAKLSFFHDDKCTKQNGFIQEIGLEEMDNFRTEQCAATKSGCCSYQLNQVASMVLPDCMMTSPPSTPPPPTPAPSTPAPSPPARRRRRRGTSRRRRRRRSTRRRRRRSSRRRRTAS
mmetsp:Transcript_119202/g.222878  ORF Transcript_119202/g.222878 Transcript_119202/m.222878 type:complete len:185 (-) Transcript_119202:36-590(-)